MKVWYPQPSSPNSLKLILFSPKVVFVVAFSLTKPSRSSVRSAWVEDGIASAKMISMT